MELYYVNTKAQSNGDHEVHTGSCVYLPSTENRLYVGYFSTCAEAVREAKKTYTQADGCYYCCRACNTR
ncbi:MAG: hypothetical protein WCJ80_11905 [Bacteroidota bacterium]